MEIIQYMRRLPYLSSRSLLLVTIAVTLGVTAPEASGSVSFIRTTLAKGAGPRGPLSCQIIKVDMNAEDIDTVWSLPENEYLVGVRVYNDFRAVVVAAGDPLPEILYVIPRDSIHAAYTIGLTDNHEAVNYRLVASSALPPLIAVQYLRDSERTLGYSFLRSDTKAVLTDAALRDMILNPELAGPGSAFFSRLSDVISFRNRGGGRLEPVDSIISLADCPIPDSVIQRKTSNGWALVASQVGFRALMSVPEHLGYADRELLVQNRQSCRWSSVVIPGAATMLQPIGGWLAGVVADMNPKDDFASRLFYPSICRNEIILVNPLSLQQLSAVLADAGEPLWTDADVIYFRQGDELCRARIERESLANREVLIKNPLVLDIHWAFSGNE